MAGLPYIFPMPGTGISCETDKTGSLAVFYQMPDGYIQEARQEGSAWTKSGLSVKPVFASPLASVTYDGGKEIRLYYLDDNYVIQEYCYTEGKNWYAGTTGKLNVKASLGSGLAAVAYGPLLGQIDAKPSVHIRVYYQEAESLTIKELANDGQWRAGTLKLAGALGGTSLAAVTYYFQNQTQIRVYYQENNLWLKEYCYNESGWFQGGFNPGSAPPQTPLGVFASGEVELRVYWRDFLGQVAFSTNTGSWKKPIVMLSIGPGYKFAVLQMDDGKYLRLYYQLFNGSVVEYYSNDDGKTWSEEPLGAGSSTVTK